MKKMLAMLMALVLVLTMGCTAALAEEDLTAHLKRMADPKDNIQYVIKSAEYGDPDTAELDHTLLDDSTFIELLLDMKFEPADLKEMEGACVVLSFPEENLSYTFSDAPETVNLVLREDGNGKKEMYKAVELPERAAIGNVMDAWAYGLADAQGLIPEETPVPLSAEEKAFDNAWNCEDAWVDLFTEDGGWRAVVRNTELYYPKGVQWEYALGYNPEKKTLDSVSGTKFEILYDDNGGVEITKTLLDDCSATFAINENGKLTWQEDTTDAGKGLELEPIGRYNGNSWMSDRVSLEVFLEDVNSQKVYITWADSAFETNAWTYACAYDPETDSLKAEYVICEKVKTDEAGNENREIVYEKESEAVFSKDADWKLTVKNSGEERLDALVFDYMDPNQNDG